MSPQSPRYHNTTRVYHVRVDHPLADRADANQSHCECEHDGCAESVHMGYSHSFHVALYLFGANRKPLVGLGCPHEQHFCCSTQHATNAARGCLDHYAARVRAEAPAAGFVVAGVSYATTGRTGVPSFYMLTARYPIEQLTEALAEADRLVDELHLELGKRATQLLTNRSLHEAATRVGLPTAPTAGFAATTSRPPARLASRPSPSDTQTSTSGK